ncbi:hypothetical protein GQ42DRAFT_181883 [Ramicandelaber brevisporus]|nr:hypothetical protein GQ42DRAFT_181883 [Ramicandelaber brevisporus]
MPNGTSSSSSSNSSAMTKRRVPGSATRSSGVAAISKDDVVFDQLQSLATACRSWESAHDALTRLLESAANIHAQIRDATAVGRRIDNIAKTTAMARSAQLNVARQLGLPMMDSEMMERLLARQGCELDRVLAQVRELLFARNTKDASFPMIVDQMDAIHGNLDSFSTNADNSDVDSVASMVADMVISTPTKSSKSRETHKPANSGSGVSAATQYNIDDVAGIDASAASEIASELLSMHRSQLRLMQRLWLRLDALSELESPLSTSTSASASASATTATKVSIHESKEAVDLATFSRECNVQALIDFGEVPALVEHLRIWQTARDWETIQSESVLAKSISTRFGRK